LLSLVLPNSTICQEMTVIKKWRFGYVPILQRGRQVWVIQLLLLEAFQGPWSVNVYRKTGRNIKADGSTNSAVAAWTRFLPVYYSWMQLSSFLLNYFSLVVISLCLLTYFLKISICFPFHDFKNCYDIRVLYIIYMKIYAGKKNEATKIANL